MDSGTYTTVHCISALATKCRNHSAEQVILLITFFHFLPI
jgi:hypothetical protein